MFVKGLKCINCGKEFVLKNNIYTCPNCNSNLEVIYDYSALKKIFTKNTLKKREEFTVFRYKELYPVEIKSTERYSKLKIGGTPLYKSEELGEYIGYKKFFIKDDSLNPSGSFKDRASIIILINALKNNIKTITGASTGNAASSLACLSASLNMNNIIFIPKTAPIAKVAQLLIFGANIIMVDGNYDAAFELSVKATEKLGLYNRNTGYNPLTREGKKSASFEIIEQMDFKVPDYVFVPMGDGNIISGVWKGFKDFYNLKLINKLPKLIGVQSQKSSAIANAFINKSRIKKVKATTIADSISVDLPRDGEFALQALKESGGLAVKVSDKDILNAQKLLASKRGIFAEPAGATAFAGLLNTLENKLINKNKTSVILITGNGLKDINTVVKNTKMPKIFSPDKSNLWLKEVKKYAV